MVEYLINSDDSKIFFVRGWLTREDSLSLYSSLATFLLLQKRSGVHTVKIRGRNIQLPRKVFLYGDKDVTHSFGGTNFPVDLWLSELIPIRDRIHKELGIRFNSCTVNWYPDGNYFIADHHDSGIKSPQNAIVTVSLGATRTFNVKGYSDFRTTINTGDVFIMLGRANELWTHGIPKEFVHPINNDIGRISLTFRDL
ncbi:2OG-Fe(II) oxygenase superfamily protein [uncultured virus]|nr:2OG-Fe(II) oxygenase superfamily protein [uncultured virus]